MQQILRALAAVTLLTMSGITPLSAQDSNITVDIAVASDVVDRTPVGESNSFPVDVGTVWCWTRIMDAEPGTIIEHVWLRSGEEMARVPLRIGGPSWRTYSSKTIPPEWSGHWRVSVRDAEGNELASQLFTVGEPM